MKMKKNYQSPTVFCTVYSESDHLCQIDLGSDPASEVGSNQRKDIDNQQPHNNETEWGNLW
jgi:hypothetical protein